MECIIKEICSKELRFACEKESNFAVKSRAFEQQLCGYLEVIVGQMRSKYECNMK